MKRSHVVVSVIALSFALVTVLSTTTVFSAPPIEPAIVRSPASVTIRSASIILKVSDFESARARVQKMADGYGAQLRDAQTEVNLPGQKHGEMIFRVDASKLDQFVGSLHDVGKIYSEKIQTLDQTSYYDTLEKRTTLLRQNESELEDFLRRPKRLRGSDVLFVQYRLFQTRVQASDAVQARTDLERGARKSVLNVMLFEPEPRQTLDWRNWHALASYRSKGAFLYVTRKLVTAGYFVLWFAPLWVPATVILFFVGRKANRRARTWLEERRTTGEYSSQ